jgi:hypothetical protein
MTTVDVVTSQNHLIWIVWWAIAAVLLSRSIHIAWWSIVVLALPDALFHIIASCALAFDLPLYDHLLGRSDDIPRYLRMSVLDGMRWSFVGGFLYVATHFFRIRSSRLPRAITCGASDL